LEPALGLLEFPAGLGWSSPALWISTWFGTGLVSPFRSGLAVATALPIALLLRDRASLAWSFAAVTCVGVVGMVLWQAATGSGDDRRIVIDEVAGFLLMATLLGAARWRRLLLAAPIYLFIDRLKIWPLDLLETLPNEAGIMADDFGAALLTILLFLALDRLLPSSTRLRARGSSLGTAATDDQPVA
jgi:phosphatidylglycerophosphatase A